MRLAVDITKHLRSAEREFHLDVRFDSDADITILFGPSGAGKSLTLLTIAGLLRPERGVIRCGELALFDSAARVDLPARRRGMGLVFQDYALFPHLTVLQNVVFAQNKGWLNRRRASKEVTALLESFDLAGCAQAYPADLSGGQRQRVALARALAAQPRMLLLDEPFAALDAPLRARLRSDLLAQQQRRGVPLVVITHDPDDVAALGGRVIHLENGRVTGGVAEAGKS